jgi:hypothetical protein
MVRPIEFSDRGTRRRPDCGMYFTSRCGAYALYHSDLLYGVEVRQPIWLAITYDVESGPAGRVIGRRKSRGGAAKVCRRHRRTNKQQESQRQLF